MQMYFHTGLNDYILFKQWVPCTTGRYAISVVGIILSGILAAFLKAYRIRLEHAWSAPTNHQKDGQGGGCSGEEETIPGRSHCCQELSRAAPVGDTLTREDKAKMVEWDPTCQKAETSGGKTQ